MTSWVLLPGMRAQGIHKNCWFLVAVSEQTAPERLCLNFVIKGKEPDQLKSSPLPRMLHCLKSRLACIPFEIAFLSQGPWAPLPEAIAHHLPCMPQASHLMRWEFLLPCAGGSPPWLQRAHCPGLILACLSQLRNDFAFYQRPGSET